MLVAIVALVPAIAPVGPISSPSIFASPSTDPAVGVDFNGDGYGDLVVTAGQEDVGTVKDAGAVNVIYGSAVGLTDGGNQLWTQDSPGILDQAETGDLFGRTIVVGDFNGDAFSDLAVGAVQEDSPTTHDIGAVNVIYGSLLGLTDAGNQFWTQGTPGILDDPEVGDRWGVPLSSGDLNADGYSDLAVGAQFERIGGFAKAGAVNVIYGSATGLIAQGNQLWTQDSPGILDQAEAYDNFGYGQNVGDFNGDGFDDLAAGAYGEDLDSLVDAGSVNVIYGSATGLTDAGNQFWTQDSPGILDEAEGGDDFGVHEGAGDLNGDGYDDLAVGADHEDIGSVVDAGAVNVIYGSATGLTDVGNQFWNQDSPNIPDEPESGDKFGRFPLGVGDMNADGYEDIAIGAISETLNSKREGGVVQVLLGSSGGLTDVGNQFWNQDSPGILDQVEWGDRFGRVSRAVDFNADGFMDVTIGVGREEVDGAATAGAVAVLYGSANGPTDVGNQLWSQNSPGILDDAEPGDQFGRWLLG